ncbi:MAG: nitrilase-related carbon-nitrogen hydrolase, partial [Planctomycetota bacterium]
ARGRPAAGDQLMKVAGIQMDIAWEDPAANHEYVGRLDIGDARLIVLPEMFATGFTMDAERAAESAGETREFLAGLAKEAGVYVLGGYAEPTAARPRNACSIYDPDGEEVLHYQKIHPFSLAREPEYYDAGDALETVTIDGVRVTPVICYDLRFPEIFRIAADRTDLFVVIANWPAKRSHPWRTLLMARAAENQAYVLGVNRVGEAQGEPHQGDSMVVDPFGNVVDEAVGDRALIRGGVDAGEVRRAREHFSFLADRRPDVYRKLEGED